MDEHSLACLDFTSIRKLLARYAMTSLGAQRALMVKPTSRRELIEHWLAQVRELTEWVRLHGLPPLGGLSDIRELVQRSAPPLRLSVEEIARIGSALAATRGLAAYLEEAKENWPELAKLRARAGDFSTVAVRIQAVIDERSQVRDDASPKLAELRRRMAAALEGIEQVVTGLLRNPSVRRLLQYPNHTFHNDRLVLPLRTECRGRLQGIVHRSSDSGATLYVEPAEAVALNNQITNLRSEESEEVARLLWDLAREVYLNADAILDTLDAFALLDLLTAKVRMAQALGLHVAPLGDDGVLDVRDARHPLLVEIVRDRREAGEPIEDVVPISYRVGKDFDLLLITGPNTGGKTVALKTIGLLLLMVQAGLPVPVAPGSVFGVFRNILIDVGDEQSMQQSLSTFSAHLKRQLEMLQKAGPQTLVLIDELGAGTDPDEGAAIGRAMLDDLLRRQCRGVITTHLGALKTFALQRPRAENARVEFDLETLRPTYKLRIGEPGHSNAIEIAQRLGMPRRLVAAARHNLSRTGRQMKAVLEGTVEAKRQAEAAREAAQAAQQDAAQAREAADAARTRLERERQDFQTWVQQVVHLQPGDPVRVRHFDRDGRIVRLRLDLQRAEVDVGAFAVEVPLGDVLPPLAPPPPPRPAPPPVQPPARVGGRSAGRASGASGKAAAGEAVATTSAGKPAERKPSGGKPSGAKGVSGRPNPFHPPLSDKDIEALNAGDEVYAKRFHRRARVIRVNAPRKTVVVSMGLLEVELPYDGLANVTARPATGHAKGEG